MIGIIQGRLTRPWSGKLQCFPRDRWEEEFFLARECGLEAIELFVETEFNPANPAWSEEGRSRLRRLSRESGVAADTLCADCFMSTTFLHEPLQARRLLERLAGFGFRRIVLPFFERAEIRSEGDAWRVAQALRGLVGLELALETTLRPRELVTLARDCGASICYDTGNTTALGHDIPADIRALGGLITHVHVKDKRLSDGQNVLLGTGDADLPGAFAALRDIGYRGDFTMETFRGDDPLATARRHRRQVADLSRGLR